MDVQEIALQHLAPELRPTATKPVAVCVTSLMIASFAMSCLVATIGAPVAAATMPTPTPGRGEPAITVPEATIKAMPTAVMRRGGRR